MPPWDCISWLGSGLKGVGGGERVALPSWAGERVLSILSIVGGGDGCDDDDGYSTMGINFEMSSITNRYMRGDMRETRQVRAELLQDSRSEERGQ